MGNNHHSYNYPGPTVSKYNPNYGWYFCMYRSLHQLHVLTILHQKVVTHNIL